MKMMAGNAEVLPIPAVKHTAMNRMLSASCLRYCPNTVSSILSMRIIAHHRLSGRRHADAGPCP